MPKGKSRYRPEVGIRYDGLYNITEYEILDESTSMHLFHMKRIDGQDPLRCEGEEVRPTAMECYKFEQIKKNRV